MNVPIIAITGGRPIRRWPGGDRDVLDGGVTEEACPHDLAPTDEHHGGARARRRLGGGAARGEGLSARRTFAAAASRRPLGRKLTPPGPRRDAAAAGRCWRRGDDAGGRRRPGPRPRARHRGGRRAVLGVVTAGDLSRLAQSGRRLPRRPGVGGHDPRAEDRRAADELAAAVLGRMERHGIMAMPVLDARTSWPGSFTCMT